MLVIDLTIYALLGAALLCSVIELGLSAYVVSLYSGRDYSVYDPSTGKYVTGHYSATPPSSVSFLVFCSLWTILIVVGLTVFTFMWARRRSTHSPGGWLAPTTLALNAITMIFWLAGFAALASLYGGYTPVGIPGALLAFAIILWLIFLAILILNILTAVSVVKSERVGYPPMTSRRTTTHSNTMAQV